LRKVMEKYSVSRDVAKNVFLRILFGGTIDAWRSDHNIDVGVDLPELFQFQSDAAQAANAIIAVRPEVVERFVHKRDRRESVEKCALAYILGEVEDVIVSTCEEVIEREGKARVSVVVFDGLMVDIGSMTEIELVQAIRTARHEIKTKLGFSVVFERKAMTGCTMQARVRPGSPIDMSMAKQSDIDSANFQQLKFEHAQQEYKVSNARNILRHSMTCNNISRETPDGRNKARFSLASTRRVKKVVRKNKDKVVTSTEPRSECHWARDERWRFKTAYKKLDIRDPNVWNNLSAWVGRTPSECKMYYQHQKVKAGYRGLRRRVTPTPPAQNVQRDQDLDVVH